MKYVESIRVNLKRFKVQKKSGSYTKKKLKKPPNPTTSYSTVSMF